eukprot:9518299-Prorocentrum_lima.AAC.1
MPMHALAQGFVVHNAFKHASPLSCWPEGGIVLRVHALDVAHRHLAVVQPRQDQISDLGSLQAREELAQSGGEEGVEAAYASSKEGLCCSPLLLSCPVRVHD